MTNNDERDLCAEAHRRFDEELAARDASAPDSAVSQAARDINDRVQRVGYDDAKFLYAIGYIQGRVDQGREESRDLDEQGLEDRLRKMRQGD